MRRFIQPDELSRFLPVGTHIIPRCCSSSRGWKYDDKTMGSGWMRVGYSPMFSSFSSSFSSSTRSFSFIADQDRKELLNFLYFDESIFFIIFAPSIRLTWQIANKKKKSQFLQNLRFTKRIFNICRMFFI